MAVDALHRIEIPTLVLAVLAAACGAPGSDADGGGGSASGATLGEPTAVFPEDFGAIRTVRELADGSVLVADPLGNALYRVDLDTGTRTQVGSEGQGPQEYRRPDAVWPLPGDSTLLVDLGNGRLVALGPDLSFGPTSPLSQGDPRSGLLLALPEGVDGQGRIYSQSAGMGGGPGGALPDSSAVLRIERGSMTADTLLRVKLAERTRSESGSANDRSVSIRQIPLSPQDTWGVAPDGSVVVARSADYHVEWHAPDGSVVAGEPVGAEHVSLGTAEKRQWIDNQGRGGGGLRVSVAIENGAMEMSFARGGRGAGEGPTIDDYTWPETAPFFSDDRILVDPLDRAWVRRYVEAEEDATYDLFDRTGSHVATYRLAGDRNVVGFGDGGVYVVAYDDFDLSYLERYALPE